MRRLISFAMAALLLLVAACGTAAQADGPPEINYGRDICIQCGMIITEARFAASYRLAGGTERDFDDLGGLLIYGHDHDELDGAEVWVHDVETEEWIRAGDAWFVVTGSAQTPMGYGIAAFAERDRAEQFAAGVGADVLTWSDVVAIPVDRIGAHQHADEPDPDDDRG